MEQQTLIPQGERIEGRQKESSAKVYLRWATGKSPLGFAAGDTNLYRYVENNAPNATDPAGLTVQVGAASNQQQPAPDHSFSLLQLAGYQVNLGITFPQASQNQGSILQVVNPSYWVQTAMTSSYQVQITNQQPGPIASALGYNSAFNTTTTITPSAIGPGTGFATNTSLTWTDNNGNTVLSVTGSATNGVASVSSAWNISGLLNLPQFNIGNLNTPPVQVSANTAHTAQGTSIGLGAQAGLVQTNLGFSQNAAGAWEGHVTTSIPFQIPLGNLGNLTFAPQTGFFTNQGNSQGFGALTITGPSILGFKPQLTVSLNTQGAPCGIAPQGTPILQQGDWDIRFDLFGTR